MDHPQIALKYSSSATLESWNGFYLVKKPKVSPTANTNDYIAKLDTV